MKVPDTLIPYKKMPENGIQYGVCRDYKHICRYKGLRQLTHNPTISEERFIALETANPFETNLDVIYHEVTTDEENRLDIIAQKLLGSSSYGWVIAYFNNIEDGFTVHAGQKLACPRSISPLFNTGEILSPINALQLNLGYE